MGNLATRAQAAQLQAARPQEGIEALLNKHWDRIAAVMPKHMSGERLFQLALSTVNTTPKLAECDAATILSCVMKCGALGLEPSAVDGLGRAYILPYRNRDKRGGGYRMEATFILGYKGMIDLARRSGQIKDISARAVYEGDEFEYSFGLDERLRHTPAQGIVRSPETLTHVYMVAHFKDGGHYMDVMSKEEVDAVRKRSKAAESGPWVTDYEAMAKKTVIRRAFPYLPVSVEAQTAAVSDETDGGFVQSITMRPIVGGAEEMGGAGALQGQETPEGAVGRMAAEIDQGAPEPAARRAACRFCGNVVEGVSPDATAEDLNASANCCEHPYYEIEE